jgi:hypothetical protein
VTAILVNWACSYIMFRCHGSGPEITVNYIAYSLVSEISDCPLLALNARELILDYRTAERLCVRCKDSRFDINRDTCLFLD